MTLMGGSTLRMYVIQNGPPDYPERYVVRLERRVGDEPVLESVPLAVTRTLEEARAALDRSDVLIQLPPGPDDPATVVERWV